MNPTGNTILITGGGSGIGRELALRFAGLGNKVIVAGRRAAALDEVAAAAPGIATALLDIADGDAIPGFAEQLIRDHPELNVVIHNAGIMIAEDLAGDFLATAEASVATNLLGPIRLTSALLPHLRTRRNAAIVTVSSGLAFVPLAATPTYSATKAAIHSWSQSLRHRLAGDGIEVIELAPPGVQTDLMPGHAADPNMMPLDDFMDETMALFATQPTPAEICVERVGILRNAERGGQFDRVFAMLNGAA
ncbi:SDR family oxidoreductase [Sphingomonas sp. G-3-2-10]|uniref:SDR family oxidoreductase n=1 Tax=Sphingomonas sp. G-3-2-10 TaxID=2728838 RepID=UPI001469D3AA|nr:SDR family oxidoreductase [Sphingomonas sp. G-3-2-10]NML07419.1 SDR family NAD(P)-dependent oxidoreductase [Sphingomonas sp. G-3-2-10]